MISKESALLAHMQDFGYNQGMIVTAMRILSRLKAAQDYALLYLYDKKNSKGQLVEDVAGLCSNRES